MKIYKQIINYRKIKVIQLNILTKFKTIKILKQLLIINKINNLILIKIKKLII